MKNLVIALLLSNANALVVDSERSHHHNKHGLVETKKEALKEYQKNIH